MLGEGVGGEREVGGGVSNPNVYKGHTGDIIMEA